MRHVILLFSLLLSLTGCQAQRDDTPPITFPYVATDTEGAQVIVTGWHPDAGSNNRGDYRFEGYITCTVAVGYRQIDFTLVALSQSGNGPHLGRTFTEPKCDRTSHLDVGATVQSVKAGTMLSFTLEVRDDNYPVNAYTHAQLMVGRDGSLRR